MRILIAVTSIVVLGVIGVVGAQTVGGPFIEQRARDMASERFGADVGIADVGLQGRYVVFRHITIPMPQLDAPLHISRLRVRPSIRELAAGNVALEELTVSGMTALAGSRSTAVQRAAEATGATAVVDHDSSARQLRRYMAMLRDMLADNGAVTIENAKVQLDVAQVPFHVERLLLRRRGGQLVSEGLMRGGDGRIAWNIDIEPGEGRAKGLASIDRFPLAVVASLMPGGLVRDTAGTMINGDLEIHEVDDRSATITARLLLDDFTIDSERIAERAVGPMDLSVDGTIHWRYEDNIFEFDNLRAGLNRALADLNGRVRPDGDSYLIDVTAAINTTDCNDLFGAIPSALYGPYSDFRWSGEIAGDVVLSVDARNLDDTEFDVDLANGCRFVRWPGDVRISRLKNPFLHEVPGSDGGDMHFMAGPGSGNWTPIDAISPFMLQAVLAHEDAGFFRHHGFAEYAIESALEKNLERKRFAFGASKISMQLAKNLYLTRDKTIARKAREALLTWWLEDQLSKHEILELYLNIIEYGPDTYGITAAAERYFGVRPAELSLAQSVYLATVLPAPSRYYRRNFAASGLSSSTRGEIEFLMRHMERKGRITASAHQQALAELSNFAFQPSPNRWQPGMTAELPLPNRFRGYAAIEPRHRQPGSRASYEQSPPRPTGVSGFEVEHVCGWHYPCN